MDGIRVAGVLAEGQPARLEVRQDVRPRQSQQGPPRSCDPRAHGGEPPAARPAQQPQDHRLRLVVPGMGHRDRRRALLPHDRPQEGVTRAPGRLFQPALLPPGQGPHVGRSHVQADAEPVAQRPAEARVLGRGRPQVMIEMGRHHLDPAGGRCGHQGVQKGYRIRPSGEGGHHGGAGGGSPGPSQGVLDDVLEASPFHQPRGLAPTGEAIGWWRCRDLNPGRRGYEPRALTN